ncbi:MAG: efflux RND transporter permease subunit [Steroidobacteraceae bacterium]
MLHTRFALRRPVTTLMCFIAVSLIGLISTYLLPLELFPDIRFPGMQVRIPYAASTPEQVEELITRPAEEALATLSGVQEIRSTSSETGSELIVLFSWDRDPSTLAFEVRTRLDSIRDQFPDGADRIQTNVFASEAGQVVAMRISSSEDLSRQYELLDRYLKKPLERLDGVARVQLEGIEPLEMRILVDPLRVAAHGVDVVQLRERLERANFSVSGGEIIEGDQRLSIRPVGEFRSVDDVRNLLIRPDLRLADIADVRLLSPDLTVGRHLNGKPGIGLDVYKTSDANIVEVADRIMALIEKATAEPELSGTEVIILRNQASNIRSSLADLRNAGLIGAVLALVVLFLFLRDWPTTLVVSLAAPFSLVITLAALYFLDFTLNVLTMMGMMLAIGMLVDNAVVTTESIFRRRQGGDGDALTQTLAGVNEVGVAVLAGTLSTIIVFLPIVFGQQNVVSVFLVQVAVPIVVAILASLVVAQTIIPTLTARFPAPPQARSGTWILRLQDWYAGRLAWILDHPRSTAAAVVFILLSPIPLFATQFLKVDMFPQDPSDRLQLPYHIEGTYPLERVEEAVNRVETYLEQNRERFGIDLVYSFYTNDNAASSTKLLPQDEQPMEPREVMSAIEAELPEIIIGKPSFRFDENSGGSQGFSLQLSGESTARLRLLARDLSSRLEQLSALDSVTSTAQAGEQELRVRVDRAAAAQLGLQTGDIARNIAVAMRGDRLREFRSRDREVEMRLAFRADARQTIDDLAATPLFLPDGTRTTLGAVADFELVTAERSIQRVDGLTTLTLEGVVAQDASLQQVRKEAEQLMAGYAMPPGYSWKFGRGVQDSQEAMRDMSINLLLAVALIFLVMASLFESMLHPISIITSILFAAVGTFWGLALSRTPMTFMAMIGIMILIGVVVNIGIVLVARIIDLRAGGMDRREAILHAGRDRLRPILMTTLTTLLALLPLSLTDTQIGGDGPAYYPMARALISGLGFGSVVSLFLVPAFYAWLDDLNNWRQAVAAEGRTRAGLPANP